MIVLSCNINYCIPQDLLFSVKSKRKYIQIYMMYKYFALIQTKAFTCISSQYWSSIFKQFNFTIIIILNHDFIQNNVLVLWF